MGTLSRSFWLINAIRGVFRVERISSDTSTSAQLSKRNPTVACGVIDGVGEMVAVAVAEGVKVKVAVAGISVAVAVLVGVGVLVPVKLAVGVAVGVSVAVGALSA